MPLALVGFTEKGRQNMVSITERLNAVQAAELIGVSVSFINQQRQRGKLPAVQIGGRFYYTSDDVQSMVSRVNTEPHNDQNNSIE